MDGVREYLLRLICAALVCGLLTRFMGSKGLLSELVKLLAGVCMAITVLSPWVDIPKLRLEEITRDFTFNAEAFTESGKNSAYRAMADIIKERTEAYILDKAKALGAEITVEVDLSVDEIPYPTGVTLEGAISPYGKSLLSSYISENLGISMEDQTWIG